MTIVYTLLHSATSEEKETKMQSSEIELVYFSATGTTRKIIQTIGKTLPIPKNDRNLLLNPIRNDISMAADHLTVVAMPVYNGRLPDYCTQSLMHLKGNGTPAIAVVVYGNREYDDALLELKTLLEKNGFIVLGAAAFIARHSIFPQVATDRPDENDLALVKDFTNRCIEKLTSSSTVSDFKPFEVKGNFPYKEARSVPMKPSSGEGLQRLRHMRPDLPCPCHYGFRYKNPNRRKSVHLLRGVHYGLPRANRGNTGARITKNSKANL